MHNTEDKEFWVDKYGEKNERKFIEIANFLGIKNLQINPEKENDPLAIDYIWEENLADLKTQTTPFFTSGKYNLQPRFSVTFNRKDYERYKKYMNDTGKKIFIFFWIHWKQLIWKEKKIEYLYGVYFDEFFNIQKTIESGAPEHFYQRRYNDTQGNAKSSFILDLRNFKKVIQITNNADVKKNLLPY